MSFDIPAGRPLFPRIEGGPCLVVEQDEPRGSGASEHVHLVDLNEGTSRKVPDLDCELVVASGWHERWNAVSCLRKSASFTMVLNIDEPSTTYRLSQAYGRVIFLNGTDPQEVAFVTCRRQPQRCDTLVGALEEDETAPE